MFSNWFSGDDLERYRTSPHKGRFDDIASSLLRLRYANEVIRQHLHEWLRFSLSLNANEGTALPAPNAEIVRQYVAQRVAGHRAGVSCKLVLNYGRGKDLPYVLLSLAPRCGFST